MSSDIEEDFPLNGGSDKLAKLFEDNTLDDITFKFSLPKHPSGRLNKPASNTVPLKVIYGKTVEAFQMKIGGYKSEGKVGIAIIGNDEYFYYQLYMYRSDERKVASAEISFQFSFLVQEHNYASFKDSLGIQWSVHFDKSSDLIDFSKEIALARWRSTPSCQCKLIQEAFKGRTETIIKKSDDVKVNYTVYKLSLENTLQEVSFEKVVTASANSANWEINLVGTCLKSKRFIIIPSQQCGMDGVLSLPQGVDVMLELEIVEIIPVNNTTTKSSSSLGIQNASYKRSFEKKEESSTLSERMSRIGYALPNLQISETESNYNFSEKITPVPPKSTAPLSTTSLISKEDSNYSLDVGDVSVTSQFNVMFSEVRTNNSEIRMNISRVNDKIETLISKVEFNPQVNSKILPVIEKIENLDGVLNKLAEQNITMLSLLEKNSLSNFQSTLNEVIHLKKRNSELETLLEVAGSTSQILKEKVDELNTKLSEMEKLKYREGGNVCTHCNGAGDRVVKVLEENVRTLEEKNLNLLQITKELERQNRELSENNLSAIQGHSNQELSFQLRLLEKDKRIENLEREVDRFNLEMKKRYTRQAVEKEITDVAKALMNKAYKTLKNASRDSSIIDHSFADALREMTRGYLEDHFEQKCPSLFELEEPCRGVEEGPSLEDSELHGKLPLIPNPVPLPIPKPRKPTIVKQPPDDDLNDVADNRTDLQLTKKSIESNKTDINDITENQQNRVLPGCVGDEKIINVLLNTEEKINSIQDVKNANNTCTHDNTDNEIETIDRDLTRKLSNDTSFSNTESYCSSYQTSYASGFYPPLIPTTPPPIIDDSSD